MKRKVKVYIFKMPFKTNYFNINQTVWVIDYRKDIFVKVIAPHKGLFEFVEELIGWEGRDIIFPSFKETFVTENFAKYKGLKIL